MAIILHLMKKKNPRHKCLSCYNFGVLIFVIGLLILLLLTFVAGVYSCNVTLENRGVLYTGKATTAIKMKQRPALVVKPIRSSVKEGDVVTVNCYVSNKDKAYLRNNTAINICFLNNDTNVLRCSGIDSYNETCNFTIVTNTSLTCGLGNCTHYGQYSFFTVAKKGKLIHPFIHLHTYIY